MTVEPSYVPRGSKLRWKSFLLLFIACCLIAYGGQWLMNQRQKKQVDTYGVCGLSNQKTRQLFESQITDESQLLSIFTMEKRSIYIMNAMTATVRICLPAKRSFCAMYAAGWTLST